MTLYSFYQRLFKAPKHINTQQSSATQRTDNLNIAHIPSFLSKQQNVIYRRHLCICDIGFSLNKIEVWFVDFDLEGIMLFLFYNVNSPLCKLQFKYYFILILMEFQKRQERTTIKNQPQWKIFVAYWFWYDFIKPSFNSQSQML